MRETLQSGLSGLGLSLSEEQINQFCLYGKLLLEKNQVMNLTAILGAGKGGHPPLSLTA